MKRRRWPWASPSQRPLVVCHFPPPGFPARWPPQPLRRHRAPCTHTSCRRIWLSHPSAAQALAHVDITHIASVLDASTTGPGRLSFVMEVGKGVPSPKSCDPHRVEPRQRLELFTRVCQAVHHAHQKGIIPPDLNPSNVLV